MRTRAEALVLSICFLLVYIATASRTVILHDLDAAEFQVVGVLGGVLHQPYPLWCILARAFSVLPLGEPAFRVTLLSIVCAALTVGVVFTLAVRQSANRLAAVAAASMFGIGTTFWHFATVAEFYGLWMLLVALLLLLADRTSDDPGEPRNRLLLLVAGALLSQQTLNVALLPALVLFLWRHPGIEWRGTSPRVLALRAVAFGLPFTLYLYTWLQDRGASPMNWPVNVGAYLAESMGVTAYASHGFLERTAFQMWIGRLDPGAGLLADIPERALNWIRSIANSEFTLPACVAMFAGFVSLWRRDRRRCLLLAVFAVPYIALAFLGISELFSYALPALLVGALYLAEGIALLGRLLASFNPRLARYAVALLALLLLATSMRRHDARSFHHLRARLGDGERYGIAADRALAPGSLVFGSWKEVNVLFYHKYVDGRLDEIDVRYKPPLGDQYDRIIRETNRSDIYLTFDPEGTPLQQFTVADTVELIPGETLYRVSWEPLEAPLPGHE